MVSLSSHHPEPAEGQRFAYTGLLTFAGKNAKIAKKNFMLFYIFAHYCDLCGRNAFFSILLAINSE